MPENETLGGIIQTQIDKTIQAIAYPVKATITKTYDDNHVDIKTKEYGNLNYVETITAHNIGDTTILIFLNNNTSERMVI